MNKTATPNQVVESVRNFIEELIGHAQKQETTVTTSACCENCDCIDEFDEGEGPVDYDDYDILKLTSNIGIRRSQVVYVSQSSFNGVNSFAIHTVPGGGFTVTGDQLTEDGKQFISQFVDL